MHWLKPFVSLILAVLIGFTSLGFAVSAHTCSESGFSETSLTPLKACCKSNDGHGFRAEPCCEVSVQHVKLATVRLAVGTLQLSLPVMTLPTPIVDFRLYLENAPSNAFSVLESPPESAQLANGRAIQTNFCAFLI
jgi:hypothetical protein